MSGDHLDRSKVRPEHLEGAAFVYSASSSLKQRPPPSPILIPRDPRLAAPSQEAKSLRVPYPTWAITAGSGRSRPPPKAVKHPDRGTHRIRCEMKRRQVILWGQTAYRTPAG